MTRRLLLDAGPAQDFVQKVEPAYSRVLAAIRSGVKVGVCYPTLGELRAGFEASDSREKSLKSLEASFGKLIRWPFTLEAVKQFGEVAALLRRIGRPIGNIDIQLAAVAMALGQTAVVTYDNDLAVVPGLKVENWLETKS
jgi:tRNA(fMet)-specific endonuclease VapC